MSFWFVKTVREKESYETGWESINTGRDKGTIKGTREDRKDISRGERGVEREEEDSEH